MLIKTVLLFFISIVGLALFTLSIHGQQKQVEISDLPSTPNFFLILGDDMTYWDCEPYGSTQVQTPNLNKLASQGITFDGMFTSSAMCSPTRQQLYTGIWPIRNGAHPNHSKVYSGTKSIVHHLKSVGYRVALYGKSHIGPRDSFPFEYISDKKGKGNAGTNRIEHQGFKRLSKFVTRDAAQPFCVIYASHSPHAPWTAGEGDKYKPEQLELPANLIDTPETRNAMANYFAEITDLDREVGLCMSLLKQNNLDKNTLFMFTSEQGNSLPMGGKWTCYEAGLKTAFIARWPGVIKPNTRTPAMAQYIDVVPTLVQIAGLNPKQIDTGRVNAPDGSNGFDGRSFLGVLLGKSNTHRKHLFGVHTNLGIIGSSRPYPIRSVRDGRYKYIRNLNYEEDFESGAMLNDKQGVFKSWLSLAKKNPNTSIAARVQFVIKRPDEELYDLKTDPYELKNLADDPTLKEVKTNLSNTLNKWMKQQGDKGIEGEFIAKQAKRKVAGKKGKRKK